MKKFITIFITAFCLLTTFSCTKEVTAPNYEGDYYVHYSYELQYDDFEIKGVDESSFTITESPGVARVSLSGDFLDDFVNDIIDEELTEIRGNIINGKLHLDPCVGYIVFDEEPDGGADPDVEYGKKYLVTLNFEPGTFTDNILFIKYNVTITDCPFNNFKCSGVINAYDWNDRPAYDEDE